MARRMFGKSSEKLDSAQLELLFDGMEEIAVVEAAALPKKNVPTARVRECPNISRSGKSSLIPKK